VTVSAINMYFNDKSSRIFQRFNYMKDDINDYYSAYNAVKHDRAKNISKANIRIMIRALAALFLLNLYYKDEIIKLDRGEFGTNTSRNFDATRGSDVFSIKMSFIPFPSVKPQDKTEYTGSNDTESVY